GNARAEIPLHGSAAPLLSVAKPPLAPAPVTPPQPAQEPAPVIAAAPPPEPPARMLCFEPAAIRFVTTGRQIVTLKNPEPAPIRVVDVRPTGQRGQTVSGYVIESEKCLR